VMTQAKDARDSVRHDKRCTADRGLNSSWRITFDLSGWP
jgi:hypothetical protein